MREELQALLTLLHLRHHRSPSVVMPVTALPHTRGVSQALPRGGDPDQNITAAPPGSI